MSTQTPTSCPGSHLRLVASLGLIGLVLAGLLAAPRGAFAQVATVDELKYPPLPAFSLPRPTRTVLPNGLVVLVMEDHELPLVSVSARFRTGSLLESPDKVGVAGLTGSQMRAGGTEALAPDALDRFLEDRAASIETGIGDDAGTAAMSVLKEDFKDVLRVFGDVLLRPRFDPARIEVARRAIEASIARQNDNPGSIATREFRKLMYGADSPFARTVTYASIRAITRDDLVAWHAKSVDPARTILAVHGDITTAEAVAAITEVFGEWKPGPKVTVTFPEPSPSSATGVHEAVKTDVAQSTIRIGHMASLKSSHPDYYAVQVLNEVLSGGFTSRLFSTVRTEKGLAYSVGGSVGSAYTRIAPFAMSTSTKTGSTAETIETLIAEARRIIAEPPTDEEIERARQSILNSFIFNSATRAQVLAQQLQYEYYGMPSDWLERYRTGIERVTKADVARVAAKYIDPSRFAILVVGPTDGRDRPLSTFGPVKTLDISIPEPGVPANAPASTPPDAAAAAAGRVLIEKAVVALGGSEAVDGVKVLREELVARVVQGDGEAEIQSTMLLAPPDRLRQELSAPMGAVTVIVSGETAVMQSARGVMPLAPSQREQTIRQGRRSLVFLLQGRAAPTFSAFAAGEGRVGGTPVSLVRVQYHDDTMTVGIDTATGRILSLLAKGQGPTGPTEVLMEFADYRPVGGLVLPHSRTSSIDGRRMQSVSVTRVELNPSVPADAFDPQAR